MLGRTRLITLFMPFFAAMAFADNNIQLRHHVPASINQFVGTYEDDDDIERVATAFIENGSLTMYGTGPLGFTVLISLQIPSMHEGSRVISADGQEFDGVTIEEPGLKIDIFADKIVHQTSNRRRSITRVLQIINGQLEFTFSEVNQPPPVTILGLPVWTPKPREQVTRQTFKKVNDTGLSLDQLLEAYSQRRGCRF